MSARESRLAPLLSTHDFKLACTQCSVKKKEITYTLKSVQHQCARNLLLCRAKDGSIWRPISKRPLFPNPSQYEVCWHFVEDSGCTYHHNRCCFARSSEEAAVWTFEKNHKLDHVSLCHLIAQSEESSQQGSSEPVGGILASLDLKAVCELCSVKEKEITYTLLSVSHKCSRDRLLVKAKASNQWRPVSKRPTCGEFGKNVLYQKCNFFVEGSGCTADGQKCTYARSDEEATVWNYVKDKNIDVVELIRLVCQSEPVLTPQRAAQSILVDFQGEFIELCKDCFHDRPQKLSAKRWNDTCSADAAHSWDPVLVHHLSENSRKHVYSQLRPLPQKCQFVYCSHVRQGKPCWHEAGHCRSAQSEVEMAVWKAEHSGLSIRSHLLDLSRREQANSSGVSIYCKICHLVLSSPESFYKHCSSLEHAQLLSEDTTTRWRARRPPHDCRDKFWLCERPQTCEYGDKCPKAHSKEELQEWMMRVAEEKEIRQNIDAQGLMSYNEGLLDEYRGSSNEVFIISEQVDDVSISCDEDLTMDCEQIETTLQWNFQVETERNLVHVALLKQEPGASFTLRDIDSEPCIYSAGEDFHSADMTYDITVSFTSVYPGLYEQWLVLDFGIRPVLLRKLRVRVGQLSRDDNEERTVNDAAAIQSVERWNRGNRIIIPSASRTEEQEELLKEYKPPQINFHYKSTKIQTPLTSENYKERMHQFLYAEEQAEDQVVSRLNVCGEIRTMDTLNSSEFGTVWAPPGQLFCAVSVPYNLTADSPEGRALKQSVQTGLAAPLSSSGQTSKVYEATILKENTTENKIYLKLSKQCCSDLSLKANESYQMEVQFQLNRLHFCYMHKAVDLLPDTKQVLPQLNICGVPVNDLHHEKLNTKQQSAVNFITGNPNIQTPVAPLLIYGPFGSGKTLTLATAAIELCKMPNSKVLICTHTNSSADLYIRDHFHPFVDQKNDAMRPIRIKTKQDRAWRATDEITLKYCLRSEKEQCFLPPTKDALDRHKVIVTTTTMARHFHDLKLPEGYFTHILIDEASQMLECEALMALALAGPNTRVVLAGDHMQMAPTLLSVDDHFRSDYTLLTRLFHYYQGQMCDAAQNSRIIFSENYRSTKEIVEFVSTYFYVGKNDIIKPSGNIPAPTNGNALKFHHVRGECLLDSVSLSWYNKEEVTSVVEEVKEILKNWPSSWGHKLQSSICVLSEGVQVQHIRAALKERGFGKVKVENLANVQGKQFRAVIMTAVQTRDSLKTSQLHGPELFNDARVLNTAMTRAQSYIVVCGDAAALCCFGKCSSVWKSYVDHCIKSNSVAPQHFAKAFFEKDLMETARFQMFKHVDENSTLSDAILRELKDEYESLNTDCSSVEDRLELEDSNAHMTGSSHGHIDTDLLGLCKKQPDIYKQGKLVRESHKRGYVIPFENPNRRISIEGRENLGKAFTGDEVVVQTTKVAGVIKEAESARVLVCLLEEEDYSKPRMISEDNFVRRTMVPITRSAPKVRILITKKKRNLLPKWKQVGGQWFIDDYVHLNENLRQSNIFVVQVIGWKEHCFFPLGYVTDIVPVGTSLDDGLRILDKEFKVEASTRVSDEALPLSDEDSKFRKDLRGVITFTVDPKGAKDLDDAISVRDIGDHYELGIHISDVASFVRPGGQLDEDARQCGSTLYCVDKEPNHMFPKHLSTGTFSLLPGEERRVVSLMFKVKKETNEIIGKPNFQLSLIESMTQYSYEDAGKIITEKYRERPTFDTIEDCVTVAYCFAKAQKKRRLGLEWPYYQPDDKRKHGNRKAHLMIEELSLLFNEVTSKTLINSAKTKNRTPLRCQAKPDREKIEEFRQENCAQFLPLSFQVRDRVDHPEQEPNTENFHVLRKVWNDIQAAAETGDVDKMVDLIAADDIHPLLQPVIAQFRECLSKARVISSKSPSCVCSTSRCCNCSIWHYSLKLRSYTQASSPIRRYMDLILQRLLHSVICDRKVQYSEEEISALCYEFQDNIKRAKKYEQKANQIAYAVSMTKQSTTKLAFTVSAAPTEDSFAVSFPFDKDTFGKGLFIRYNDLQLWEQPSYDDHCMTLRWKKWIYTFDEQIYQDMNMPNSGPCIELPLTAWRATLRAIDEERWEDAKTLIMGVNPVQPENQDILLQPPEIQRGQMVDMSMKLQPGDILQVQITSEINRGYCMPAVQLLLIKPKFEICVDHVRNPVTCFSKWADDPAKDDYRDTNGYIRIWEPLCNMESATNAVDESDSVVIENLAVNFKEEQGDRLTGNFFLPLSWTREWAVDLSKCFLCIRKRGLSLPKHSEVDPEEFTWVAHGVAMRVEKKKNKGSKVEFYVHHLPMKNIPPCIFLKDMSFTVEIIPKLVPDNRKIEAVTNITSACDLVKAIALGERIPRQVKAEWNSARIEPPNGLPMLNPTQRQAVNNALNDAFTLIQGPPGTGKTIVGVYIVYYFFELNSKTPMICDDPKDRNKKQVILYCGPSNKSVDVVADYLLRFSDTLKPLRVYGQQVEMLDYPYPDCNLQYSQSTHRQDKAKPELRKITLHHRMREDQNLHSKKIKEFDARIKRVIEREENQLAPDEADKLSPAEVEEYKNLLVQARKYELERHDIILCTCTQSSTPILRETVCAREIIIDECAMATEPQTLIPLVCNKPEKIVLIGDHKQLQPIVKNTHLRKLRVGRSLFERYYTMHKKRALMLDIQYRMHEEICKFPSLEYYEGKLQTGVKQPGSVLRVDDKTMPIVFGDIVGETDRLVVSTFKGNENSKANKIEKDKVIAIAKMLVNDGKIKQQDIAILSPYNAQVSEIREELRRANMHQITVTTITKSQGSEWRYIIISMVCSLPLGKIPNKPDGPWLSKHLGFVGFPNQINVGITRAKEGLCIIGNQKMLRCSCAWDNLLSHYTAHNAVTDADRISVKNN